jgi:tetratricopeptide (TPR) repeat protein
MDIGILAVLTGIYKLAEKTGLLKYVNNYGEKAFDALYEKLVQDSVFDGLVKKFFKNYVARKFEAALDRIAPQNETFKRKFLLSMLTDPTINETISDLNRGHLPQQLILTPVFERALGRKNVEKELSLFYDLLKQNLKKDQEFTNLVVYSIYEMNQEIVRKITEALGARIPTPASEEKFKISTAKLPTTQHALFGRDKELKRLDGAWANPHCHVLSLVAFGGVGKTALVNEWLNRMEAHNWRDAERVYGWSFYSQGTREDRQASADTFFEDALTFFGHTGEPLKSPWDKGKLLASLIKERKTLLILDGLEPLQYPPGEMEGCLRDQGLQALLKELARFNNGLCLITTRCKVTDIEHTLDKTTHQIDLENLSPEAGMQLLRETGVTQGTDKELQQAATEYEGHALALTLLGRYLAIRHKGEIRKRDTIKKLAYEKDKQGIHVRHVMDSYEHWLHSTPELELLYIMGLFDRPAPLGAIEALKQEPVIRGLTDSLQLLSDEDWDFAIQHLRDLRLLSASEADKLDCHPLIREHFGEKLRAKGENPWQEAHSRLYEYYRSLPEKLYGKELPDTLEEMEPLFTAVAHGCQAKKHNETMYDVFWPRIRRKSEGYSVHKLGAFGSDLASLSNFFDLPWAKIALELKDADKAGILSWTGFHLRALGRLREAAQPMQAGMEMQAKNKDWENAAPAAGNLSEIYLISGDLPQAINYARQSVDFADRSGDGLQIYTKRITFANAQLQAGEIYQSEDYFQEAENLFRKRQPEYKYMYSLQGFLFCDLLLSQGKVREVLERAKQTIEIAVRNRWLLDIALDKLSLGRAYLLEASEQLESTSKVGSNLQRAADYLNQAVAGLREAGQQDDLPRGLFARAFLYRVQNQFSQAWDDLTEAQEIAERGGMKLWLVDYHLEAARLMISEHTLAKVANLRKGELVNRLKRHVEQAAKLVQETGYHRRDPEVEMGYASLFLAQGDKVKAREHLDNAKGLLNRMGIRMWDWEVRRLEKEL